MVASYLSFPSCRSIRGGLPVLQNGWMAGGGGVVRITHGEGGGGFGRGNLKLDKAIFESSSEIAFFGSLKWILHRFEFRKWLIVVVDSWIKFSQRITFF